MKDNLWRVLIIDDSPEDRQAMRLMLSESGLRFHITEADTGALGLRVCLDNEQGSPDCVLLDYHLPDYDAPELLAEIGGPESPCCPVVVVTGLSGSISGRTLLRLGAQDLIGKSWINSESLVRSIENAIERFGMVQRLREREELARQRAEEMETLMDSAPIAIFVSQDPECRNIKGNRLANQLYEAEQDQNISAGSTLGEPIDSTLRFFQGGRELCPSELPMQTAMRERREIRGDETDAVLPSGRTITLLGSARPLFNDTGRVRGSIGAFIDITERKHMEQSLRESENRFRSLFESSADALALYDSRGYIDCNEACLRMFGCAKREEFLRRHPSDFSPLNQPDGRDSKALAQEIIETTFKNGKHRFDWQHLRFDGTEFPTEVLLTVVEFQGKPVIYAVARDISERKAILASLAEAKNAAEQANQAKSLFLANMSHEIRTPMNALVGMTELCLKTNLSEQQRNYLGKIKIASNALICIIDDILDFTKIEADKLALFEQPFILPQVLDNLASLLVHRAHNKGLELAIHLEPGLASKTFLGDPQRLGQVLINLVGNAIKFSSRGQVRVSVSEQTQEQDRSILLFAVTDDGIGISPEEQSLLFQPFSQADASTTRNYGGTGLGLALSRRLVEMMGGVIGVNSVPDQGSTFHFTIRCALTDQAPVLFTGQIEADSSILARLRGADILLAEDAELSQEVICGLLTQAGMKVRLAVNGLEVLKEVEKSMPDCVLMDCQMPVMDGFEATRRLRAQERYRDLPIIALTANTMAGDREKCLTAGMNGFLSKPVNLGQLFAALAQWVRPRQAQTAESTPELPELPDLPGVDTGRGLQLVGGEASYYMSLLQQYRDNRASNFAELFRQAQQGGDWNLATRLAHNLKGVSRTLGMARLGNLAEQLEQAAQQGQAKVVTERLGVLEEELCSVLDGLIRLVEATPEPEPAADCQILISDLDRLLEEYDTAAIKIATRLKQSLVSSEYRAEAEAVYQATSRYDYPEARERLRRLTLALNFTVSGTKS